jgi:hypothetical protein
MEVRATSHRFARLVSVYIIFSIVTSMQHYTISATDLQEVGS